MRILIVINYYQRHAPSGVHAVVENERRLLEENGHEVAVFSRENDDLKGLAPWQLALRVGPQVVWSSRSYHEMRIRARLWKPDIVHVHETFPQLSPSVFAACHRVGVPVVQTLHNYRLLCVTGQLFREGKPCEACVADGPWRALEYGCYRSHLHTLPVWLMQQTSRLGALLQPDRYLVLSEFSRRLLAESGLPEARFALRRNFVFDPFPSSEPPHEGRRGFLFAGRLDELKGVEVLGEAVRLAPELPWKVAGSGPSEASLPRQVPGMAWLGSLDHDALQHEMAQARALVCPSLFYESGPMVVIEAFAAGLPVIAAARGPLPEMIRHEENGLLVPPGDARALAAACHRLEEDPDLAARLSRGARAAYRAVYTPELAYASLLSIYEHLLRDVRPPSYRGAAR